MKNHGATASVAGDNTCWVVGVVGGFVVVVDDDGAVVVVVTSVVVVTGTNVVVVVVSGPVVLVVVVSVPGGATVLVPHAEAIRVKLRITAPERFIASPFRKCQQCCRH
jgi:hypothetical protein